MKVGLVIDNYFPVLGGAEVHVYYLSKTLQHLGHDVIIYTNTLSKEDDVALTVIRNTCGLKTNIRDLVRFIRNVDVVHCHYTYYLSSLTCFLAKLLRKPTVVTLHGLGTLDSSVGKSRRMKAYRWLSFKLADAIIATSNEMAEVAERFAKRKKIYVIPNAVNTNYFKLSSPSNPKEDKIIVLSMRRLNPKNGVQYLVEAIPYIVGEFERIEFWIAGKTKLESYLRKRVEELGILKYVKFIGEIPNEKTKHYYEAADIVVFPSSAESTSIACLEAMAMEKAVVASSLKVYKDLLGNSERGLLVELFDRDYSDYVAPLNLPEERISALANAIITLSRDEVLCRELGKRARKEVEKNYDWTIIADRISQVYENLAT